MKYAPIGNRVLIELDKPGEIIGGIILPESARGKSNTGTVRAVGTGHIDEKGNKIFWRVKPGDKVVVEHTLDKISVHIDFGVCEIYRQNEILAIIEEE